MIAIKLLFWLSLFIIAWEVIIFPLLLAILARFRPQPVTKAPITPSVSIIIAVHNEGYTIERKLKNTLELDYPKDKLEIIVVDDASTDNTSMVVADYIDKGIKLFTQDEWKGKTAAQNLAVSKANGDILFFTDATALLNQQALLALVSNYADHSVGCVTGRVVLNQESSVAVKALRSRLSYEQSVRASQGSVFSLFGATGCIYVVRKELYQPLPEDQVSDLLLPLLLLEKDYRTVYDSDAVAALDRAVSPGKDFIRRSRVVLQSLRAMWYMRRLLTFKCGSMFVSSIAWYRLLRWLLSIFILVLLITNLILIDFGVVYKAILFTQLAFYVIATMGALASLLHVNLPIVGLPFLFVWLNAASLVALYNILRGEKSVVWQTIRSPDSNNPPLNNVAEGTIHLPDYADRSVLSKLAAFWQQEGSKVALTRAFSTIAAFFYSNRTILEYSSPCTEDKDIPAPSIAIRLEELGIESLDQIDKVMYHSTAAIRRRFALKERCFAAFANDNIVAYAWLITELTPSSEASLKLENGRAYIYNVRTLRALRGKGIYPSLLAGISVLLANEGFKQVLIRVSGKNTASIKGIEKAGFSLKTEYKRIRIFGISWQKIVCQKNS